MTLPRLSRDIPIGDVQFYDSYVPALEAGNWRIEVNHTIQENGVAINGAPLTTTQYFVVSAPQVHIDSNAIVSQYPPNNTRGQYGEVLPHVVLGDPMLPWERSMPDDQPWLALLVFSPDELVGATSSVTRLTGATLADFLTPTAGVLKPDIADKIEADIDPDTQPCSYIEITTDTFTRVTPRLDELRFLTHCRQINTGDKAILGLDETGLFSIVVANRFPARPAGAQDPPTTSIVHLVSLEGFEAYLDESPDFAGATQVQILTLASWTFSTMADSAQDFRGLVDNLVAAELDQAGDFSPENLWLRAPLPALGTDSDATGATRDRVQDGFVPLTYHTRVGAETFAWYRGPLTPLFTTTLARPDPFFTSDAALIYDPSWGVFDTSLATAFQIGRALALSDKRFGAMLLDFRRRTHRITDNLLYRLQSEHFSAAQIDSVALDSLVQDEFIALLDQQLLDDIGAGSAGALAESPAATDPPTDPKQAVQEFLAKPEVQALLLQLVAADLDPLARWLARLSLLYPVPFNYLVADPQMLPVESLRFFYLDTNWIAALLDGALTLGMASSRDTFSYEITRGLLHDAAKTAAAFERARLSGVEPSQPEVDEGLVSGFLLRSALVSGWPNLAIRPRQGDQLLKILRMDHLASNVLFCLLAGVPDLIEFSEPQEGFRFGVDDDGNIPLRTLTADSPDLGKQLDGDPVLGVYDLGGQNARFMRTTESRVLNLAPSSATGLVQGVQANNPTAPASLGPGGLALQMIKSPEAIQFISATQAKRGQTP